MAHDIWFAGKTPDWQDHQKHDRAINDGAKKLAALARRVTKVETAIADLEDSLSTDFCERFPNEAAKLKKVLTDIAELKKISASVNKTFERFEKLHISKEIGPIIEKQIARFQGIAQEITKCTAESAKKLEETQTTGNIQLAEMQALIKKMENLKGTESSFAHQSDAN